MPVVVTFLFSAALSAWHGLDAVFTARLEWELRKIRQAGHPVTLAELDARYNRPLLAGENAAPVLQQAFAAMEKVERNAEALARRLPIVGQAELPPLGQPLEPQMVRLIRRWLDRNRRALDLLHKAGRMKDCRFPLDLTKGFSVELRHLARLRGAVRLLCLEALAAASAGDGSKAAEAIATALKVSRSVHREPFLVSALVRIGCCQLAIWNLERALNIGRRNAQALIPVQQALVAEATDNFLLGAMVGERCVGLSAWAEVRKRGARALAGAGGGGDLPLRLIPPFLWKADEAFYLQVMNDYVEALTLPAPRRYIEAARVAKRLEARIPRWAILSRMLLPALERVFALAHRHDAQCEAAAVAIAALRFREKNGRYPDRLEALVPEFIEAVPLDPFDGKLIRYRKVPGGIIVYSVGEDRRDDGGAMKDLRGPDLGFRLLPRKASF